MWASPSGRGRLAISASSLSWTDRDLVPILLATRRRDLNQGFQQLLQPAASAGALAGSSRSQSGVVPQVEDLGGRDEAWAAACPLGQLRVPDTVEQVSLRMARYIRFSGRDECGTCVTPSPPPWSHLPQRPAPRSAAAGTSTGCAVKTIAVRGHLSTSAVGFLCPR